MFKILAKLTVLLSILIFSSTFVISGPVGKTLKVDEKSVLLATNDPPEDIPKDDGDNEGEKEA